MAQSTAELLATTAALLDASESMNSDLRRIAKQTEPVAAATTSASKDAAAAATSSCCSIAPEAGPALSACIESCAAAAEQLKELATARSRMAELRKEMLDQVDAKLSMDKARTTDGLKARRLAIEAETQEALRAIMTKHGLPAPPVPSA